MRLNIKHKNERLFRSTQKYIELYAFFAIFPLLKIGGISITFPIFILIAYKFIKSKKKIFRLQQWADVFLLLFLLFVFISWILQEDTFRERSLFSIVKIMVQYSYWVMVALFIKTWIFKYNFYQISRAVFYATLTSIVYYIVFNHIHRLFAPNELAYVVVTALPIGYYYVMRRFPIYTVFLISVGLLMGVLYSGSRTGTILTLFELMLLLSFGKKSLKKFSITMIFLLLPIVIVLSLSFDRSDIQSGKYALADMLESYSPKIARTLRMDENVFDRDKSWLIRELMLVKGKEIFLEHPFFGIGPGNFGKYFVHMNPAEVSIWLNARTVEGYNTISSQNSYLMILSENGIFALICIVIVFIYIVIRGFHYLVSFKNNAELYVYIPFVALLFYAIILVTTMGTLFWFELGLALTLTQRKRRLQ